MFTGLRLMAAIVVFLTAARRVNIDLFCFKCTLLWLFKIKRRKEGHEYTEINAEFNCKSGCLHIYLIDTPVNSTTGQYKATFKNRNKIQLQ